MQRKKIDIREYKRDLRAKMKNFRSNMDKKEKELLDRKIRIKLFTSKEYKKCSMVIVYISMPIEVDTKGIILKAWKDGKTVVVPKCITNTHEMNFHIIKSFKDVEPGTFGVLEPIDDKTKITTNFTNSICIIPALSYDKRGYRLGYGGGYYDRFLSYYKGVKIGIIYEGCIVKKLIHGRFDIPVDIVVSENNISYFNEE